MSEFIQKVSTEDAELKCNLNFNRLGNNHGIDYSEVPFTEVGRFGIFKISVRKYKTFSSPPSWGYSLSSDGGMLNTGGYSSCQEAIEECVKAAKLKEDEFYKNYPQLQD